MGNLSGFDADTIPESDFSAIPKGIYPAFAVESEKKPTKNGKGEYLQFTFEIVDGQHKGRKLWARLNLWNPNQAAVDIAQRELAQICKAAGMPRINDSSELHNIVILLHVDTELNDRQQEVNVIKKYESPEGGGSAAPTRQAPPQSMAYQKPGAFASARDAARATADSYSPPAEQEAAGEQSAAQQQSEQRPQQQPWRRSPTAA
ncbi:DUF669 domain-containing protein [Burkholderia sp. Bp8990]|uniref:DUF669 domain-containing protein n=1 Tax=Burkholderia sp. Bp8990 TaxID=2184552 RepID=UPI000F596FDD|nr:DUF669 domain-containing protein [Burkholderia sp. Bp8990]RQS39796.1 DUF669 domain-containing protein [Burkholderia sp. Bp8990]